MRATISLRVLASPGSLSWAASVAAQSSEDRAAAQALFDQGAALMQKGDFAAACPKLEASLQRFDGIGTRGKLAQCYGSLGRIASAWAMYREVATLAARGGDERRAAVARDAAAALEPRVPYLTLSVPDRARVEGLMLKRNGVEVVAGAWDAPVAVDPGEQRIEASAPGYKPWIAKLDVAEATQRTVEVPALTPLPQEETDTAPFAGSVKADPASATPSSVPWRPIAIVTAGVGVVSLGVGGFFGLRASSKWNEAFDDGHCRSSDNTCSAKGQELTDDSRDAAVMSNIFIGAGAVLAASGVAMWFLAPADAPTEQSGVRVVPVAERDRGGVWVHGRF